jgi:hypothetical protein
MYEHLFNGLCLLALGAGPLSLIVSAIALGVANRANGKNKG